MDEWQDEAACRALAPSRPSDPDLFFDFDEEASGDGVAWEARLTCLGCPVREPCLASAFLTDHSLRFGVWGGTLPVNRLALRAHPDRLTLLRNQVDNYGKRMASIHEILRRGVVA